MAAYGGVDGEREDEVHGSGGDSAVDVAGHADGVGCVMRGAEDREEVFLRVVEVWFESDAGVGFFLGGGGGAEVDSDIAWWLGCDA